MGRVTGSFGVVGILPSDQMVLVQSKINHKEKKRFLNFICSRNFAFTCFADPITKHLRHQGLSHSASWTTLLPPWD
jgi:hypothetical protein